MGIYLPLPPSAVKPKPSPESISIKLLAFAKEIEALEQHAANAETRYRESSDATRKALEVQEKDAAAVIEATERLGKIRRAS